MAGLTLKQSGDLTNDRLQQGVVETMATESKLLSKLPFMTVEGHGYSYNVEKSLAGVGFRKLNEAYSINAPTTERRTEFLTILGGEAVVDSFQQEVHTDVNDLMAIEVQLTSKAIAHKYEKHFINGDESSDADGFDGLITRYGQSEQAIDMGATLVGDLDVILDSVQGGADALIMNKKTRRNLTSEAREQVTYYTNEFGVQVAQFGGVDIMDIEGTDIIGDDFVVAVKFGAQEAVSGLQSKSGLSVKALGEMDSQPQSKTRIEWFTGLAVFNDKAVAIRTDVDGTGA